MSNLLKIIKANVVIEELKILATENSCCEVFRYGEIHNIVLPRSSPRWC